MVIVTSARSKSKFFWVVVSVIVYGLKILGLAPFAVQTKKSGENSSRNSTRTFVFSKMGLIYNILLLVFISTMVGVKFPYFLSLSDNYQSSLAQSADLSQGLLNIFTVWIVIISWTFNQRKAACIMNKIVEIDAKLSAINKQPTNKMTYMYFAMHVIISSFAWVIIWAAEFVQPTIADEFLSWLFFTVPGIVIYGFVVEYFIVVGLVASRFEIINKNLSNFKEFCEYSSRPPFLNDYPAVWSLSTRSQLDALNLISNIRMTLSNLAQDIAEFFSFPILVCVASAFFSLIYNVYFLITPAIFPNSEFSLATSLSIVSWLFTSLYSLSRLFLNVTKTLTEAKLTGRLVHKLLSTAVKEEMKTELELFSLQLLHENINFTAYGFFTLDFTLLHSMLGATATYLVILIQFNRICDNLY